jgi:hypothetical protein
MILFERNLNENIEDCLLIMNELLLSIVGNKNL